MTLFWNNLLNIAGAVITPETQNTDFPASNLTNYFRKKAYKTTAAGPNEYLIFDFLTAQDVTSVILLDHNFIAGDFLTVQRSTDGITWTNVYTYASFTGGPYDILSFALKTFRYWKFLISKVDSNARQIGKVFVGTGYTTAEAADYSGVKVANVDPSTVTKSSGGQSWTDVKQQYDTISVPFSTSPDGQVAQLVTIFQTVGTAVPIYLQIDATVQAHLYYCKFAKGSDRTIKAFDSQIYWDWTLNFEEQI